jgi:hypothetical protein
MARKIAAKRFQVQCDPELFDGSNRHRRRRARRTVSVRRNRQTGTIVETVSAQAQDLDDGNGETKWYNICQPHATLCGHRTLAAARWFAARPLEWCEDCNAEHGDGGEE